MVVHVKGLPYFLFLLALLATNLVCPRAGAQQFGLSVKPSANPILVSNSLTYTITVTNLGYDLNDAVVTNTLPASVHFQSAGATQGAYTNYSTSSNTVVAFELGPFYATLPVQLTVTVLPTATGAITNSVIVASAFTTNTAVTNVVVNVTNIVNPADIGVTMIGPKQVVITNDWITYGILVTNSGPNAASSITLTNIVPKGVIAISPTNQTSGTNRMSLVTLSKGASTNFFFTVQPTNIAVLQFSASVGAPGLTDPNTANNVASTNIVVTNYLPGVLVAVTNSPQNTNFILGLLEQSVTVSNIGTSSVPAVRIVLTGLTNRLYNSVGTNNGHPFVYYSAALSTNQSGNLLLQYLPRKSFPFTNSQLQAFAVPVPDWTPPSMTGTRTNININRILQLTNGNLFIDWASIAGKTYTIVYSDNLSFSNSMIAPPSIVAGANDTGWIDYGPPTTTNAPVSSQTRFYRVYQNP